MLCVDEGAASVHPFCVHSSAKSPWDNLDVASIRSRLRKAKMSPVLVDQMWDCFRYCSSIESLESLRLIFVLFDRAGAFNGCVSVLALLVV